ncbi:DUF4173 domain-containing protein [Kaistella sp. G5-32]|uniref:DUF4173 domain-containing protein n=1 Tax=Kaistella gelatinilytica TaxID=2787636 RepID=A0ABS0FDB3_9FLAO|nr:DUF4153 domain-containing protein [Kaistella gelatinilytica]MBF8457694.1 DUF4173 domain-containing protein [Kaistella gelatinilytica]
MKKHHLILLTTALFITLFYGETAIGINLGVLGISYSILLLVETPKKNHSRNLLLLFVITVFSSFAFAWFGDFISGLALFTSLFLFALKAKNRELKSLLVIPLFIANFITFIGRFFKFDEWFPRKKTSGMTQKIISVFVIPFVFIAIFFGVYSLGSDHFSSFFSKWEFDLNLWEFFWITVLGFFLAFTVWNFKIYHLLFSFNHQLKNDFVNEDITQKPTYSFLDLNAERKSGVVSFIALNLLLLIFIVTFNYEQFVEISKNPNQLSAETHERVNAVILSIILAICVIMFYFKGNFNFDIESKSLKILAKIWIVLNAVLVISAVTKNSEYILNFGLTYKRLGVYAFLILALIGLILTFYKIHFRKTNAFLFNQMFWYFYGTMLVCSFVNWGGIITSHNMGRKDFALNYHQTAIDYSEKQLLDYAKQTKNETLRKQILLEIELKRENSFLSKTLYYETTPSK